MKLVNNRCDRTVHMTLPAFDSWADREVKRIQFSIWNLLNFFFLI